MNMTNLIECPKIKGLKLMPERCAQNYRDAQPHRDAIHGCLVSVCWNRRWIHAQCLDCEAGRARAGALPVEETPCPVPGNRPKHRYVMRRPRGKRVDLSPIWRDKWPSEGEWMAAMFREHKSLRMVQGAIRKEGFLIGWEALRRRAHDYGIPLMRWGGHKQAKGGE